MSARVRRAGADDVDTACAALADAFADYEWTRWTVDANDHVVRIAALQRLFIERVALAYGEVWVADDEGAGVSSAAIWMLPTSSVPAPVLQAAAILQADLEGIRHEASVLAEAAVVPLRPTVPHYYLGAVGTRADRQREGLATAVLAPILERSDADGAHAFLETSFPGNVSFYERLGFVVTGEVDAPGGGPHVWAMTRAGAR